jgi:TonB family protein
VYNDIGGDASVTLDRAIKGAYGARYTIVDMDRAKGYAGPRATAGELPSTAAGPAGEPLSGYVLAAYIVTAEGAVSDPVVLKATDKRLGAVALEAMRRWRFSPATLNGSAVASTAAQEFTFGPGARSESFRVEHIAVYQAPEVLLRRLPDSAAFGAYIERLRQVAGHFFAGSTEPESFSIVVLVHPGHGSRAWFVSSRRKGDDAELGRLRALLEAVEPVDVREGPAAFAIVASVAGGDPGSPPGDRQAPPPVPREWRDAVAEATAGVPYGSDAFLEAVWRSAR